MKDEIGMTGPKSTPTKIVGIITSTIHPYAWYLWGAKQLVMSPTCKSRALNKLELYRAHTPRALQRRMSEHINGQRAR